MSKINHHLFIVCRKDQYGAIDVRGEIVIEPRYKGLWTLSEGLLGYDDGKRSGVMDVDFAEGLAPASREWLDPDREEVPLYGYIDKNGEFAIEPRFESADLFGDDRAPVSTRLKLSDPRRETWG